VAEPLHVLSARSTVLDDAAAFPVGSVELDDASLMRDVGHSWHARPDLGRADPGAET
jgi:hypothetical protein